MNRLILLVAGLILAVGAFNPFKVLSDLKGQNLTLDQFFPEVPLNTTDVSKQVDPQVIDFTGTVHTVNKVKHLLSDGEHDYKITWDVSLAELAETHSENCPTHRKNVFFGSFEEFHALELQLESETLNSFSLASLPTRAVRRNGSMQLHLDIGSRIGCALSNCSESKDFLCHFDTRRSAQRRIGIRPCERDEEFRKLCNEQPFDYFSQDCDEFGKKMMTWNDHRRTVAKEFNVPAMYELCWSNEYKSFAEVIAHNCTSLYDLESHFYAHPRSLEPLQLSVLLSQHLPSSEVFPPTLQTILAPNQNVFGCAPTDPQTCREHSYYCVIGPEPESTEIEPKTGDKLCGECPGDCFDGLCQPRKEEEKPPKEEEKWEVEEPERAEDQKTTSTEKPTWETWKIWALVICVFFTTGIASFLLCTLTTTDYD